MICFFTTRRWQVYSSCGVCSRASTINLSNTLSASPSSELSHGLWISVSVTVLSIRSYLSVSMRLDRASLTSAWLMRSQVSPLISAITPGKAGKVDKALWASAQMLRMSPSRTSEYRFIVGTLLVLLEKSATQYRFNTHWCKYFHKMLLPFWGALKNLDVWPYELTIGITPIYLDSALGYLFIATLNYSISVMLPC